MSIWAFIMDNPIRWRVGEFFHQFSGTISRIPGLAFGLTFEKVDDWEYGDYGERFGCDIYIDIVVYFICWRASIRWWDGMEWLHPAGGK